MGRGRAKFPLTKSTRSGSPSLLPLTALPTSPLKTGRKEDQEKGICRNSAAQKGGEWGKPNNSDFSGPSSGTSARLEKEGVGRESAHRGAENSLSGIHSLANVGISQPNPTPNLNRGPRRRGRAGGKKFGSTRGPRWGRKMIG